LYLVYWEKPLALTARASAWWLFSGKYNPTLFHQITSQTSNTIKVLSYWEYESFFKELDAVVIGSGIVGLSAAISMKEKNPMLNVAVIERGFLPYGASTRNAGFACFGSISELLEDLENSSETEIIAVAELRFKGLKKLRGRLGDKAIRYEELSGMEIFRRADHQEFEKCAEAMPYFNRIMAGITGIKDTYRLLNDESGSGFGFQNVDQIIANVAEGQIHTGEMMKSLLLLAQRLGILFLNGLNIESLHDNGTSVTLQSDRGWTFTSPRVMVCTNGFAAKLLPQLDVVPARNQVMITAPINNLKVRGCFHYDRGYFYFRNIDDRILLGGGRNLDLSGEQTAEFGNTELIQQALKSLLTEVILPNQSVEIERTWSGILGLGAVKKPIIEKVSPNVTVAVRMGGMGVAIGSIVGEMGADLMLQ
jgi:glycine/D-amino acid oxidase-like deaminating enzyme